MNKLSFLTIDHEDLKKTIYALISAFISAFFLASVIQLFKYDVLRNFYNIKLVNFEELSYFLTIFIISFMILFILNLLCFQPYLQSITSLFWIVFLVVFAYFSPVKSLIIGAVIIAIPSLFITIYHALSVYLNKDILVKRLIHTVISSATVSLFILLLVILIVKSKLIYIAPDTVNLSNISDTLIYAPHMMDRWLIVLYIFLGLLFIFVAYFLLTKYKNEIIEMIPFKRIGYVLIGGFLITQLVMLSLIMSYRVKTLISSTYDFGIFLQMFHNMRGFNGMVTTLERSVMLSHLNVHFSPIYYLMLPIFMILPYGETLQVLQILVVAVGVIPLWLIAKELKTHPFVRFAAIVMYIASPALITSHFYDLHENCFLAPLILFVLYFAIKRKTLLLFLASVLLLFVKEDAALYLFFIGLYLFINSIFAKTKDHRTIISGFVLMIASICYFLLITHYLNEFGDGAMFWRYDNLLLTADGSIFEIIQGFLLNPSYYLATFFSPLKINTIVLLLASVGFIPFLMKNFTGYILMIPVAIINYLSTYPYQHQFGFQYFYGSATLIIFMVLLAEKDHQDQKITHKLFKPIPIFQFLCLIGLSVSLVHGFSYIEENSNIIDYYHANESLFEEMKSTLKSIPNDKKVVATGFLTPYLADREYLYDYDYFQFSRPEVEIDYVIVDGRINAVNLEKINQRLENLDYTLSYLSTEHILIYEPKK